VGDWVHYRLVSELQVETPRRYGMDLLVMILWLISSTQLEIEKLRRNGIAKIAQNLEHQRSFVKDRRVETVPSSSGVITTMGSREFWIVRSEGR
jgi:hypothetical protein